MLRAGSGAPNFVQLFTEAWAAGSTMAFAQFALSAIPNTEFGGMSKVIWVPFVAATMEAGQPLIFRFAEFNVKTVACGCVKPELLICSVTPPKELAVGLMIRMLSAVAV